MPVAAALRRAIGIEDAYLTANGFSRVLTVPKLGPYRIVRSYSEWNGERVAPGLCPTTGHDTVETLSEAGIEESVIEDLLRRRVVVT